MEQEQEQEQERDNRLPGGLWLSLPGNADGSSSLTTMLHSQPNTGGHQLPQRPAVRGGSCHHWGAGAHYRLFDGTTVISLLPAGASCERVLLAETRDNLQRISAWMATTTISGIVQQPLRHR